MTAQANEDVFHGTSMLAGEIGLGLKVLVRKVRDLQRANDAGNAIDQKLTAESIAKLSGQIQTLAETTARVTVRHLARRPRP